MSGLGFLCCVLGVMGLVGLSMVFGLVRRVAGGARTYGGYGYRPPPSYGGGWSGGYPGSKGYGFGGGSKPTAFGGSKWSGGGSKRSYGGGKKYGGAKSKW